MDIVDILLQYRENNDTKLLIESDLIFEHENLNVIVIEILAWLKLEYKRSMWIAEGKKTCLKPLKINMQYPWCSLLKQLVEEEKIFRDYFIIESENLYFSDYITEYEKEKAREKAYINYNPKKNV